mgnify:CR=1 FL=1
MKKSTSLYTLIISSLLCVTLLSSVANAADMKIKWTAPEDYQDIKQDPVEVKSKFRIRLFKELEEHLVKLAQQLPEQKTLMIEVTDLALAGEVPRGTNSMRIISDRYPPRIEFSYQVIKADKTVVSSGNENIRDKNFMMNQSLAYRNDSFGHEKYMLDKWFKKTFPTK